MKMAELLLSYGADPNWIVDKSHGYTLLMQLCSVKMQLSSKETEVNYQIIKFLLENGVYRIINSRLRRISCQPRASQYMNSLRSIKIEKNLMNCSLIANKSSSIITVPLYLLLTNTKSRIQISMIRGEKNGLNIYHFVISEYYKL